MKVAAAILFSIALSRASDENKPVVTVAVHDKIDGHLNWAQNWFVEYAANNCPTTRCVLSPKVANDFNGAGVVLYHAPTHMNTQGKLPKSALHVLISLEQPKYAQILQDLQYLDKSFDLLATYSTQEIYPGTKVPNMHLSYFPLNIIDPLAVMQPARDFKEKDGFGTGVSVVLFTSNCGAAGATGRYQYVEKLIKLIPIHSYGKCFKNRDEPTYKNDPAWPPIAQRRARKVKVLSKYKFYLAFENLGVPDYVSEKIYEGLFAGAVPVYRGTTGVGRFMPSNDSFIDANDMTPEELADMLKRLSTNENQYNKYLEFKSRPMSSSFVEIAHDSYTHPNVLCRLCDYALRRKQAKQK